MTSLSKRDQLIHTALELFSSRGFHATGIDLIARQSGVTKKTLYAHFHSKDELILATLRHLDGKLRHYFLSGINAASTEPRERLLALFDVAGFWFSEENFFGCTFINAVAEYADKNSAIRQICAQYKRMAREYIQDLCEQASIHQAAEVADQLAILLEGAIVTAQVSPQLEAATIARRAATILIDHAISQQAQSH